jgi:hypothetical protein
LAGKAGGYHFAGLFGSAWLGCRSTKQAGRCREGGAFESLRCSAGKGYVGGGGVVGDVRHGFARVYVFCAQERASIRSPVLRPPPPSFRSSRANVRARTCLLYSLLFSSRGLACSDVGEGEEGGGGANEQGQRHLGLKAGNWWGSEVGRQREGREGGDDGPYSRLPCYWPSSPQRVCFRSCCSASASVHGGEGGGGHHTSRPPTLPFAQKTKADGFSFEICGIGAGGRAVGPAAALSLGERLVRRRAFVSQSRFSYTLGAESGAKLRGGIYPLAAPLSRESPATLQKTYHSTDPILPPAAHRKKQGKKIPEAA